jgi:hypothetical protein
MSTTATTTLCCGHGHRDQIEKYPVGTKVRVVTEMTGAKIGAIGKVTGHCDDGRAWISFDGHDHGNHTFHQPGDFLVIDSLPAVPLRHEHNEDCEQWCDVRQPPAATSPEGERVDACWRTCTTDAPCTHHQAYTALVDALRELLSASIEIRDTSGKTGAGRFREAIASGLSVYDAALKLAGEE